MRVGLLQELSYDASFITFVGVSAILALFFYFMAKAMIRWEEKLLKMILFLFRTS